MVSIEESTNLIERNRWRNPLRGEAWSQSTPRQLYDRRWLAPVFIVFDFKNRENMIDEDDVPDIEPDELLSRCVLSSKYIRAAISNDQSNGRVKAGAFIPHPHDDLSVNRHKSSTLKEVWQLCQQVARQTRKNLYGRAEVCAEAFSSHGLVVKPNPIRRDNSEGLPPNPNHAIVFNWPVEKSAQLMLAQNIADGCRFLAAES